jgi:hypothetical protein
MIHVIILYWLWNTFKLLSRHGAHFLWQWRLETPVSPPLYNKRVKSEHLWFTGTCGQDPMLLLFFFLLNMTFRTKFDIYVLSQTLSNVIVQIDIVWYIFESRLETKIFASLKDLLRNLSVQRSCLQYTSQCLKKVNVAYIWANYSA